MSNLIDWYQMPHRPYVELPGGPLDEGFLKTALHLADQDPLKSGVFYASFLAEYFELVASGFSDEIGHEKGSRGMALPEAVPLRRSLCYQAAESYRQCQKLQELYHNLCTTLDQPPGYIGEGLKKAFEVQALLAATAVRHIRKIGIMYSDMREDGNTPSEPLKSDK